MHSNGESQSPEDKSPLFQNVLEVNKHQGKNINDSNQQSNEINVLNLLEHNNNINSDKLDNTTETVPHNNNDNLSAAAEVTPEVKAENDMVINENYRRMLNDTSKVESNVKAVDSAIAEKLTSMDCSDSCDNIEQKSLCSDNLYVGASCSLDNLDDEPDKKLRIEIIQSTGKLDDTLSICTIAHKTVFRESHSLDILDSGNSDEPMRPSSKRKHARNKSITLTGQPQLWKSVDAISKPAHYEKGPDIESQLMCYDEALRQLAEDRVKSQTPIIDEAKIAPPSPPPPEPPLDQDLPQSEPESIIQPEDVPPPTPQSFNTMFTPISPVKATDGDVDILDMQFKLDNDSIENEPSSIDTDKDEGFPPPPKCFMENEDDITLINSVEILNNSIPISKLTPIKETYLELDSLTSNNIDAHDSDNTENSVSKHESTPCHFDVQVIVNNNTNKEVSNSPVFIQSIEQNLSESSTLDNTDEHNSLSSTDYNDLDSLKHKSYNCSHIVSCHLDGGDLFLTDQVFPEYYDRYFVDVKALQFQPNDVNLKQIMIPPDSPSPKASQKSHKLIKGKSEEHLDQSSPIDKDSIHLNKSTSLNFDIGGICYVSKMPNLIQIDQSDSESEGLERPLRRKRKQLVAMRGPGVDSKETDDKKVTDTQVNDLDSADEDPPFWQSTEKGGHFTRQETVISSQPQPITPRNTPCRYLSLYYLYFLFFFL
jgi:hypothetical protein